jgi:hypothetical protein
MKMFNPVVDELTSEIQRSLGYYKSLAREARFERILAIGNAMRLEDLHEMVAKGLQYDVTGLEELRRIELDEQVNRAEFREKLPGACAALGLLVQGAGLGRMQVNMVPERVALTNALSKKKPALLATALCVLLSVGVMIGGQLIMRGQVAGAQEDIKQYEPLVSRVEQNNQAYQQAQSEVNALVSQLQQLARPRLNAHLHEHIVPVVAKALPEDYVYLRSVRAHWVDPTALQVVPGQEGEYTEEMEFLEEERQRSERLMGPQRRQDIPGPLPGSPSPEQTDQSVLVLTFEGETYRVGDEDFISENVFGALEAATYPGGDAPVFSQVDTFSIKTEDVQRVPRRIFRGRAVVNLDAPLITPELEPEPAPSAEPAEGGGGQTDDGDSETETER